jgi:hypothetical protein
MAYTRKYLLQRIRRVNEVYREYSSKGVSNEYIYRYHIRDQFNISRATFYEYLTVPYNAEIKKIEESEKEWKTLF